jgi:hypothetical protein
MNDFKQKRGRPEGAAGHSFCPATRTRTACLLRRDEGACIPRGAYVNSYANNLLIAAKERNSGSQ